MTQKSGLPRGGQVKMTGPLAAPLCTLPYLIVRMDWGLTREGAEKFGKKIGNLEIFKCFYLDRVKCTKQLLEVPRCFYLFIS